MRFFRILAKVGDKQQDETQLKVMRCYFDKSFESLLTFVAYVI